jgi:amino-acid N-acetyltransferase
VQSDPLVTIRPARTPDVWAICALIDLYSDDRILLSKATVTLFEDVPDFVVAEDVEGRVVGCAAVHVLWEDLAEVRTLAVSPAVRGTGVGRLLLQEAISRGRQLGVRRMFCLTFQVDFFTAAGFVPIGEDAVVEPDVYAQLLQSYDEGVAEFLDLERVKPNTLGNTRMLLHLDVEKGSEPDAGRD